MDSIKRLLKVDRYIGRGSRQRSLGKSRYSNTFKVSQYGRSVAISSFREALLSMDIIRYAISMSLPRFRELSRRRVDRRVQEILPKCVRSVAGREEPESDEGSSPDEGVRANMSDHCGKGQPVKVGVGYTQSDFCPCKPMASWFTRVATVEELDFSLLCSSS